MWRNGGPWWTSVVAARTDCQPACRLQAPPQNNSLSCFRWLKFEEDVEDGGERWSKPYVATLSLHSLFELRSCIINSTVLLDMRANTIEEIAGIGYSCAALWCQVTELLFYLTTKLWIRNDCLKFEGSLLSKLHFSPWVNFIVLLLNCRGKKLWGIVYLKGHNPHS